MAGTSRQSAVGRDDRAAVVVDEWVVVGWPLGVVVVVVAKDGWAVTWWLVEVA